jgi:uncharacterized protein YndB with AHSA1/START domain
MFLVHRRDIVLDGSNPTLLTGYGGFGSSATPSFARNRFLWMDQGGVFAEPCLRGGGEYGDAWHRAGMLANKQNSFDDFIAAAEWLIDEGYTSPERLAIWGGSNGGLLIGAFVTQRPDLAAAAISDVPLLDMVRFHRFYGATMWTTEYGHPEDPEQFQWLYGYSPYHHVEEGVDYPAMLITTAESDTRVHPSHAMKMVARLQAATAAGGHAADLSAADAPAAGETGSGAPVLLRFERAAGHGAGTPMSMILDQYTDYYAFLFEQAGSGTEGSALRESAPRGSAKEGGHRVQETSERTIHGEVVVDAPVSEVWRAWTTKEGAASFFAPDCSIELEVGGAYEMYFIPDAEPGQRGGEGCTILAIQPEKMLSFTWNAPPSLAEAREQFTHVTLRFEPLPDNRTRVTLTQDGWGEGGKWDEAFDYFKRAWLEIVLPRLVQRFEG